MSKKKSPEYVARMAEAKTLSREALIQWARTHGYTDGVEAMPDSTLRSIFADDRGLVHVGVSHVENVDVGRSSR
jgi:hypothetical protein